MTKEELAVEVTEKVWGWDLKSWSDYSDKLYVEHEVFSWEGFGRTVGAMRCKYPAFPIIEGWDGKDVNELFEATHRAALEAIGDE